MATIDDLEAESHLEPEKVNAELVGLKLKFLTRWAYPYNKSDMSKALDELLEFVKTHR